MLALRGVRVLELAGLAPVPMCGMMLSDFGADVIRVDRSSNAWDQDCLHRGKRSIAVDLKSPRGVALLKQLAHGSDVLLDPYRPGVLEKLGLAPSSLLQDSPHLIVARISGYGQTGPMASVGGHDINYISMSGLLNMFGRPNLAPKPPVNLAADFAGGSLLCAFAVTCALRERDQTGKGKILDLSMTEGAAYVASFLYRSRNTLAWARGDTPGVNVLDGGFPLYDTYETADGKYMAVGALELPFQEAALRGLGLSDELHLSDLVSDPDKSRIRIAEVFKAHTQEHWTRVFEKLDACVTPVLSFKEASSHPLSTARSSFVRHSASNLDVPRPAPLTSDPIADDVVNRPEPRLGQHTLEVLREAGLSQQEIDSLVADNIVAIKVQTRSHI